MSSPLQGGGGKKIKPSGELPFCILIRYWGKEKENQRKVTRAATSSGMRGGKKKSQWRAATMYSHSILKKKGKNQRKVTRAATSCGEEEKIA